MPAKPISSHLCMAMHGHIMPIPPSYRFMPASSYSYSYPYIYPFSIPLHVTNSFIPMNPFHLSSIKSSLSTPHHVPIFQMPFKPSPASRNSPVSLYFNNPLLSASISEGSSSGTNQYIGEGPCFHGGFS